jgi:hypothetical protein
MTSPLLKVTGRGTVDVVTSSLDFSPSRRSSPDLKAKAGPTRLPAFPSRFRIEGPFDRPDLQARDQVHVLETRAGVEDHQPDRRRAAEEAQGQAGGEAIGRILGGVRIGNERSNGGGGQNAKPPANQEEPDEEGRRKRAIRAATPTSTISCAEGPGLAGKQGREILTLPANSEG